MSAQEIEPTSSLTGKINVPGDKSISHRVLMLAALANGKSEISGLSLGQDVQQTESIISALGAKIERKNGTLTITGGEIQQPNSVLDVGNSGTGIRLFTGLLSGIPIQTTINGDSSIQSRPMDRVISPLQKMGAEIKSKDNKGYAPLEITGKKLTGIEYEMPIPSAQVKSAILFAGLSAQDTTTVIESHATRTHTEELMAKCGIDIESKQGRIILRPSKPEPFKHYVEGDPSQAAFWAVGGLIVPHSHIEVENVYSGTARTGFIDVLHRMGADIQHNPETGTLVARSSSLHATKVESHEIPSMIDEIPILAVAAACAEGTTVFEGLGELKVKETNRLETIQSELSRMGVTIRVEEDSLIVSGGSITGGNVHSHGDHRIAMASAIAALVGETTTQINGWEAVSTSYPKFEEDLSSLTGKSA